MYKIYRDGKVLTDMGVMTRTLKVERQALTKRLNTVPAVHDLFICNQFEWISRSVWLCNE